MEVHMKSASSRTHIVLPAEIVSSIDAEVGKRQRSRFIREAAERELRRLAQARALAAAKGSWREADHPELKGGSARWIDRLRSEGERRLAPRGRKRA